MGRSGRGRRRDNGNRGGDYGQQEVLNQDVGKRDALNNFLKTLMDVCILWLRVRVLELRTREVVLLGGNVGKYLEEVGRGGNKSG